MLTAEVPMAVMAVTPMVATRAVLSATHKYLQALENPNKS
jgi:hypothetical protein